MLSTQLLLFSFCFAFSSAWAALIILDDTNPRITWEPPQIVSTAECQGRADNLACDGSWWEEKNPLNHNSTVHVSWGPSTSFSFSFTGSSFMIFGDANNLGADCLLEVDGVNSTFTTQIGGDPNVRPSQMLKEINGLNATQRHDVRVSYYQYDSQVNHWLGIDFIMLDQRGDGGSEPINSESATGAAEIAPTSSTFTGSNDPNAPIQGGGITPAFLAAIVVLGLLCVLFIGIASLLLVKLRRLEVNRDSKSSISLGASESETALVERPDTMRVEPYVYRRSSGAAGIAPGKPRPPVESGQRWGESSGSTPSESIEPGTSASLVGGHGAHPLTFALVPVEIATAATQMHPPAYYRS